MFFQVVLLLTSSLPLILPQEPKSQLPLCGLAEAAAKSPSKLRSSCAAQMKSLHYAIRKREAWALGMVDSSGAPADGFLWGNNYWLGTYSQCRWMLSETAPKLPPFGVDFFVGSFWRGPNGTGSEDVIHLGLCLPSSCSVEDLGALLKFWANQRPLAVQNFYNYSLVFQKVRRLRSDFSWATDPLFIILSVVATSAVVLTASGTVYDLYVRKPSGRTKSTESRWKGKGAELANTRNIREYSDLMSHDNNLNQCHELKIDNSQHKSIPVHVAKQADPSDVREAPPGAFVGLSLCFSAAANVKALFRRSGKSDEASLAHGLRFSATAWLVWLYSVFYLKYHADNKPLAQKLSGGFSDHVISNSTFAVDTFFFASGFLLAFKYYKDRRGARKTDRNFSVKKKVNEFSLLVLKRCLRLTPLYAVVLGAAVVAVRSARQTSLFEVEEEADEICQKYWWRNLAYLNNLFEGEEICVSWSWYLSTDMQFFLLGTFILILSTRYWKFASFFAAALVVLSSAIAGYLSYSNRYVPSSRPPLALLRLLHYSPWTRVGPYLVGMFAGYFVVHSKGELVVKKTTLVTCWLMWFLCNVWALFGLCGENTSVLSTALHAALSRTAWAFGLSWIVVASSTGHAGAIRAILSYEGWIPFSKLSYSAYLLAPLLINLIVSNAETAAHLDFFQTVVSFFGFFNVIYFCAFLTSLLLEIPLATLGRRLGGKGQMQNQLNDQS